MSNREDFEAFYEQQWSKRRVCQRCEAYKYPKDFNKTAPVCRECVSQMGHEEVMHVLAVEEQKEAKKISKFKF